MTKASPTRALDVFHGTKSTVKAVARRAAKVFAVDRVTHR